MARLPKDGISSIFGLPLELCSAVSHHSHYENNNCHVHGETIEWNSGRRLQWNWDDAQFVLVDVASNGALKIFPTRRIKKGIDLQAGPARLFIFILLRTPRGHRKSRCVNYHNLILAQCYCFCT